MRANRTLAVVALCALAVLAGVLAVVRGSGVPPSASCVPAGRAPGIRPDYAGAVIPPNIAPLNFAVQETGVRYHVRISSARGQPILVSSRSPKVVIPRKAWKRLLEANRGGELSWDVCVRDGKGQWQQFDTFRNRIAQEDIDGYLAYRKIRPLYNFWVDIGVYQRNLTNFQESAILFNNQSPFLSHTTDPCVNCHTFVSFRQACMNRTGVIGYALRRFQTAEDTHGTNGSSGDAS
jgi:hypothetical protein